MRVVILAAGSGTRLKEILNDRPKCLVEVAGRPLLLRHIEMFSRIGARRFDIVVGHRVEMVQEALDGAVDARLIVNHNYRVTNTLSSYRLALAVGGDDPCFLVNADVVYEASVIEAMLAAPATSAAVKMGVVDDEAVTVSLDGTGGIRAIGKKIANPAGEAFGVYRFSSAVNRAILNHPDNPRWYYEDAINRLLPFAEPFMAVDIGDKFGAEIDTARDYHAVTQAMRARGMV